MIEYKPTPLWRNTTNHRNLHSAIFWHISVWTGRFMHPFPHFRQRQAIFAWLFVQRGSSLFLLTQTDTLTALMGGNNMICLSPQKCCNYSTLNIATIHQMEKSVTASVTISIYICICMLCTKLLIFWSCKTGVFANSSREWTGLQCYSGMQKIWPDNSLHSDM